MPTRIPDRYQLEMRLGRDGDIEEWLASDRSLDRPVLIRSLGPEAEAARREQFVKSVSAAAKAHHPHLAKVYVVEDLEDGAYSVVEWTGGATVADRLGAAFGIELEEFLPNAAGLAAALAALHEAGAVHGSIDLSAISYAGARAAKLGGFGRPYTGDPDEDVRALSAALETALTGEPPGGPPPSETIDGISPAIDGILRAGQTGKFTARELEKALKAAPTPRRPKGEPLSASRRLLFGALGLVILAVGLIGLGALFGTPSNPITPAPTSNPSAPSTTIISTTTSLAAGLEITSIATHDPFGGGGENDDAIGFITDGSLSTLWRTERYRDPLQLIKDGVGVVATVTGQPSQLQLTGFSQGTVFEVRWIEEFTDDPAVWERIAAGVAPAGTTAVELPARTDGFWMLWMTELPLQSDGTYYAELSELRLRP